MSLHDRVVLAEQVDPTVETLYIFDQDSTLIHHPSRQTAMRQWREKTGTEWPHGNRFWSVAATLKPPFKITAIAKTKAAFKKAKADPKGKVVVMTGRIASPEMKKTIPPLLKRLGYGSFTFGDNLFLKRVNAPDTLKWKLTMLDGFVKRFPNLKRIEMWDDRAAHLPSFRSAIKRLGLEGEVTHVNEPTPASIAADREISMSLFDRIVVEQFPNAPWWSMRKDPYEPHEKEPQTPPKKRRKLGALVMPPEDEEQPMDNPLPGNMDPRASTRASGTRLQRMRGPRPLR